MTFVEMPRGRLEKQIRQLPQEVRFCSKCVVSNQRPRITFDENGVCSACQYAEEKYHKIDWNIREKNLCKLLDQYRRNDGHWDVLVPVSGGKDSSYVAHILKYKYGMNPLTVTWSPIRHTDIGFKNWVNFTDAGFMNILAQPNGVLHRKLVRLAFEEIGDPFVPFIYGVFSFAFHIALKFDIKLVFYGENGEVEYGGDQKSRESQGMPLEDWARVYFKGTPIEEMVKFGVEHTDYFEPSDLNHPDLKLYAPPSVDELRKANVQMHWMGYYRKWIPQENYYYAAEHAGLQANPERSEGTHSKYASLDDMFDGFHFYMAYIKFGIGRATSDAAHEIRDGHLSREEGAALVRRYDGEFPKKYFKEFLDYTGITEKHFWEVVDSYRAEHLWELRDQVWKLRKQIS